MKYDEIDQNKLVSFLDQLKKTTDVGTIETAGGVDFQARELINTIGRYTQSKFKKGDKTKYGKIKHFRNIGNFIVDLEWRAKNIDRKAIEPKALDGDYVFALVVGKELQNWMKENNFGKFIDDFQRKETEYGGAVIKKTESEGKLYLDVVPWNYFYFDPRDIKNGPKAEVIEFDPLELEQKRGIWENVDDVLDIYARNKKDVNNTIKVYDIEAIFKHEIFGQDKDGFGLYNVILAEVAGKYFILFVKELKESRYKYVKRKSVEGRDFGVGVWEEILPAQIAVNEAVIAESEAMDIAGKVIIATNKQTNIPTAQALINGEIIHLENDEYMNTIPLAPPALPKFQQVVNDWIEHVKRDQSAYAGITGEQPKASTPFSSLALQAAQSASIFNKRRDLDGFFLNEVIKDWVLPHLVKKINKSHKLTASFSYSELKLIDDTIKAEALNNFRINAMLGLDEYTTEEQILQTIENRLKKMKNTRTLFVPKGYITMDRIKAKLMFDITDEMSDAQRELNALATRLQALAPDDPARMQIINEMTAIAGYSPAKLNATTAQGNVNPKSILKEPDKIKQLLPEGSQ